MKKIKIMMLALALAAVSSYATTYVNVDFESDIVGTNPVCSYSTPDGNATNSFATTNVHAWVVASSPIGTGKALEYVDNVSTQGVRAEWDLLPVTNGRVSSCRFDYSFTPLRTDGIASSILQAAVAITNGNIGGSANRFFSLQMFDNGTIRARAGAVSGGGNLNPILTVVSGTVYRASFYVNDTASTITYTDPKGNSATNTLRGTPLPFGLMAAPTPIISFAPIVWPLRLAAPRTASQG